MVNGQFDHRRCLLAGQGALVIRPKPQRYTHGTWASRSRMASAKRSPSAAEFGQNDEIEIAPQDGAKESPERASWRAVCPTGDAGADGPCNDSVVGRRNRRVISIGKNAKSGRRTTLDSASRHRGVPPRRSRDAGVRARVGRGVVGVSSDAHCGAVGRGRGAVNPGHGVALTTRPLSG